MSLTNSIPGDHFTDVVDALGFGTLVPVLGAGANLCDRGPGEHWVHNVNLPAGAELSTYLADEYGFPADRADRTDLLRVSQWIQVTRREGRLVDALHHVFDAHYEPTTLHSFLAALPRRLRAAGRENPNLLIVTTNYDDALEQAFAAAHEPYTVLSYRATPEGRCWMQRSEDLEPTLIRDPASSLSVTVDERSAILKVHGAVRRGAKRSSADSYVISEDHYIDFLARTTLDTLVPKGLLLPLLDSDLLFLGYRLQDWNMRVMLHEIWRRRSRDRAAWAIQLEVDTIDQALWDDREITLYPARLDDYVQRLEDALARRLGDERES